MNKQTYQLTKPEFIVRMAVGILVAPILSFVILLVVAPMISFVFGFAHIYNPIVIFLISFLLVFIPVLGYWIGRFCIQKIILQTDSLIFKWYFGFKAIKWSSIESFPSMTFDEYSLDLPKNRKVILSLLKQVRSLYEKGIVSKYLVVHYTESGRQKTYACYISAYKQFENLLQELSSRTSPQTKVERKANPSLPLMPVTEIRNIVVTS